jgi:mRNA-degrading endonuclease toxin of MazEF toxin-antitoxin module
MLKEAFLKMGDIFTADLNPILLSEERFCRPLKIVPLK